MLTFKNFLEERNINPVDLGIRTAQRFGKRSYYGKWMKAEKGKNIPLTSYDRKKADKVDNALWKYQNKLGIDDKDPNIRAEAKRRYDSARKRVSMDIDSLHATQPFVRTDDVERLKSKIEDKNPTHIHVITHNGVNYIADGHHAVMAAKLRGEKTVNVSHLDLDKEK